jgi:hypothetical protein
VRRDLLDGKVWNVKASRLGAVDELGRQDCLVGNFTEPVDQSRGSDVPDEGMIGFNALAVPIIDGQTNLAAMIGMIGPTRILPAKASANLVSSVKLAGMQISAALGGLRVSA